MKAYIQNGKICLPTGASGQLLQINPGKPLTVTPEASSARQVPVVDLIQKLVDDNTTMASTPSKPTGIDPGLSFFTDNNRSDFSKHIRYCAATGTLLIFMKRGKVYEYSGVPPQVASNFEAAESWGRFYRAHILGKYTGRCLND